MVFKCFDQHHRVVSEEARHTKLKSQQVLTAMCLRCFAYCRCAREKYGDSSHNRPGRRLIVLETWHVHASCIVCVKTPKDWTPNGNETTGVELFGFTRLFEHFARFYFPFHLLPAHFVVGANDFTHRMFVLSVQCHTHFIRIHIPIPIPFDSASLIYLSFSMSCALCSRLRWIDIVLGLAWWQPLIARML